MPEITRERMRAAAENRQGGGKSPRVGRGEGSSSVPRPPRSLFQCVCVAAPAIRDELSRSRRERFFSPSFAGCKRMVRERLVFPQPDHFERESCLLKISLQLMEPFHDAMVD